VLSRKNLSNEFDLTNEKLKVVLHQDFANYDTVLPLLSGYDTCFWYYIVLFNFTLLQ
jgi:hypothetical protein